MAMIRCPECGQRVSSMALTCPHCGVGIKGHLRECPHCGEWMLDDQSKCPECDSPVETGGDSPSVTEETGTGQVQSGHNDYAGSDEGRPNTKKVGKKSNTVWWVAAFLFLLIGIGSIWAAGAYFKYKEDVLDAQVEEEMRARMMEEEKRNKEFAEIQRKDSLDWVYAKEVNTVASMERYLELHPQGNYMDDAMMRRDILKRTEVTEEDRARIRSILESKLTEAAARKNKSGDILGFHYQISGDLAITKEETPTGSMQFFAKCKVNETISRTDPTKPTDSTFVLRAILDIDKNVLEINL
ncbi:MAG: zinc ribbon domain-containing protein [Bacteroidaceae bacterium]|nr:zinc ribbon domain-containing protein [Bacteroidaceae bacterium]